MFVWVRRALVLVAVAFGVVVQYEAGAQTSARRDRNGKEVTEAVCAECHATGVKGAPRIGERADWSVRLSHGIDNAVNRAIRGHGGMPARGGKAELTDNEVKNAIIYMFNPGGAASEGAVAATVAPAPAKPASNVKTVSGTEVYLGVLPAEVLRAYPENSAERSMHGGVPDGTGYYHVNVTVLDATTKAPVSGARVDIRIDERGITSETKTLQPMAISKAASYGNYIKLKRKTQYVLTIKVQKPDAPQPIEARFDHRVY